MPTALLAGAFGQHNPGDEALLDAFVRALPGWRHVATSRDPAATRARGVDAVPSWSGVRVARAAMQADAVIFAGGTVFKALDPRIGRPRNDLLVKALMLGGGSKLSGKPLAMVGLGAGDLPTPAARMLARSLVRLPDLLVLRDEESAEALGVTGAPVPFRVGADPAWTLLDEPPEAADAGGRDVIVALSGLCGMTDLPGWLAAALAPLAAHTGLRILLQPWQSAGPTSDEPLAYALAARLGASAEILPPPRDLKDARETFAEARLVLGLRFHALLAAASAGVPFVAVAHEAKLAAVARRLHQRSVVPGTPPEQVVDTLLEATADQPPSPATVRGEIARAEESFRLMRLVLSGGRTPEAAEVTGLPLVPEPEPR